MRGLISIAVGFATVCVCARGQVYTNWMGDEVIGRPLDNALAGQVAIYCGPSLSDFGRIIRWEFFDNDTPGKWVTPIVFERLNETDFRVWAVGAARDSRSSGLRSAIFDVEKGGDEIVGPGFTFGFVERQLFDPDLTPTPPGCMAEASRSRGVVDYEISPNGQWAYTTDDEFGICIGQVFRIGGVAESNVVPLVKDSDAARTYSARVVALLFDPPISLTISRGGDICWLSRSNRHYQVQWTTAIGSNSLWQSLGMAVVGDGGTNCVSDSLQDRERKYYRVLALGEGP